MTHFLLEGYDLSAPWIYHAMKSRLSPDMRVVVIALSFRPGHVRTPAEWDALYAPGGRYYQGIVGGLSPCGIVPDTITFLNIFTDTSETAAEKIRQADVLYFPGGLPDAMMERIRDFGLFDLILQHRGLILGYSAGAVIQLAKYHLSPDKDYPSFSYYEGLPWLSDFYLEVHYEGFPTQNEAIRRVLDERKKRVYAPLAGRGGLMVENGTITPLGEVMIFDPKEVS